MAAIDTGIPGTSSDSAQLARELFADRVRLLYEHLPLSQSSVVMVGIVLALIQAQAVEHSVVFSWLAAAIVLVAIRFWMWQRFRRLDPAVHDIDPWYWGFMGGVLLSGCIWGAAAWLLFPDSDVEHQFVLVFVLAGMSAGSVTTLSPMRRAALAFLIPTMVPLIVRISTMDHSIAAPLGALSALFLVMVSIAAWRGRAVVTEALALRHAHRKALNDLRLAATAFQSQEGIRVLSGDGVVLHVNEAMSEITGFAACEMIGVRSARFAVSAVDDPVDDAIAAGLRVGGCWRGELWEKRKNGETFPAWLTITAVTDDAGRVTHYVEHIQDITERKQAEARIAFQARYDALTELPNRRFLMECLSQDLSRCRRFGRLGGVLFIDLDRFKTINDSLGHSTGDAMLREVADRLRRSLRHEDTAARFGGDEFVVVLTELGTTVESASAKAEAAAQKLNQELSRPYEVSGYTLHTSCSIGIALYPLGANEDAEDALKHADVALYHAKDLGRNGYRFYSPRMSEAVNNRLQIESDLRTALEAGQFVLALQPQVNAAGEILGAEALLRWHHPTLGTVAPNDFIPVAEDTGLIVAIGEWVLDSACAEFMLWRRLVGAGRGLSIAVNVSPREFYQANFVDRVLATLRRHGMDPACLELELTEGMLLSNITDAATKMTALSSSGVRVAIDDFGTGYSSLAYLKRLPLDTLKIDQSFVRDVTEDEGSAAIIQAIIAVAHHLGLSVIAEGVETELQARFLRRHGCFVFQGYHYSPPVSRKEFRARLGANAN